MGILAGVAVGATAAGAAAQDAAPPAPLPQAAATVGGVAIPSAKLVELLVASYGKNMLEQLIALELVRQEAAEKGITITEQDVEAELEQTARQGGFTREMGDLRKLLAEYSREKGYSWAEFDLTIRRNAYLRKLVEPAFKLEEAVLRAEYDRLYTEKVEVRIIRTQDPFNALGARQRLRNGEDFGQVAREMSNDASGVDGGLLPPFSRGSFTGAMKAFEEAAFALTAPGDVSAPVGAAGAFYVIKLLRRVAPEGKSYEQVRDLLYSQLYPRVLMRAMLEHMKALRLESGKVTIHIPVLSDAPASRPAGDAQAPASEDDKEQ
jgi:parvulin-like peptidyl-prolyl isomerase